MSERKKVGIVLFQLGGPDSPDAIEGFLYNLFCDPDIIDFFGAWFARRPLARWIARKRARLVRERYEAIGGYSPIRELTERQARALEAALAPDFDARCFIAMRYWKPFTAQALAEAHSFAPDELVLFPLYPQFSLATTSSSLKEWNRVYAQNGGRNGSFAKPRVIEKFYDHPLYTQAVVDNINVALARFANPERAHIVFSAHGLPLTLVERGDPYPGQVKETVRRVVEAGGWKNPHSLGFQSKVGRRKWLPPSLIDTIESLAGAGEKNLLIVPIAFVTEHVETLHEVNIEARELAMEKGIEQFEMMPAVGDSPKFISALADLVRRSLSGSSK